MDNQFDLGLNIASIETELPDPVITLTGADALTASETAEAPLLSLKAYGRSWQSAEPTAETPADISSIGDSGNFTITACGKNLFPWNDYASMPYRNNRATSVIENNEFLISCKSDEAQAKGVYISSSTINDIFKIFDGKTLTASAEFKMESEEYIGTKFQFGFQDSGRVLVESTGEWQKISVTMNFDASLTNHFTFYAREYSNTTFAPVFRVRNIQIEIGDTASGYEPYRSASAEITTGLPLRGVPVSSGGNYTDGSGQEWVCDTLDHVYGEPAQITGRTGVYKYSGVPVERVEVLGKFVRGAIHVTGLGGKTGIAESLCDVFPYAAGYSADSYHHYVQGIDIWCFVPAAELESADASGMQKWLLAANPTFIYQLAKPKTKTLTTAETEALNGLSGYSGSTSVYNENTAEMTVKLLREDYEMQYIHWIKESQSFVCGKSGKYKIICVGGGSSGGLGAIGSTDTLQAVGTTTSFGTIISADGGGKTRVSADLNFDIKSTTGGQSGYDGINYGSTAHVMCASKSISSAGAESTVMWGTGHGYGAGGGAKGISVNYNKGSTGDSITFVAAAGKCGRVESTIVDLEENQSVFCTIGGGGVLKVSENDVLNYIKNAVDPAAVGVTIDADAFSACASDGADGVIIIQYLGI